VCRVYYEQELLRLHLMDASAWTGPAQVASHRRHTAKARIQPQGSPRRICGGLSDTETGFRSRIFGFSCQLSPGAGAVKAKLRPQY
jgi:hypothetical protein